MANCERLLIFMAQIGMTLNFSHALRLGIEYQDSKDGKFAQQIYKMSKLAERSHVKSWERHHACAVRLLAEGHVDAATRHWEDILVDYGYSVSYLPKYRIFVPRPFEETSEQQRSSGTY